MIKYEFDKKKFVETFEVDVNNKSEDDLNFTHNHCENFKLFPYKAGSVKYYKIVYKLEKIIGSFFQSIYGETISDINFDDFLESICQRIGISNDEEKVSVEEILKNTYFEGDCFIGNNIKMYQYQNAVTNDVGSKKDTSVSDLGRFLFSVFQLDKNDCEKIKKTNESNNILDELVIEYFDNLDKTKLDNEYDYFVVRNDIQEQFKIELFFMLDKGMTSDEEIANLLAIYYLLYMTETCITLSKFFDGTRNENVWDYYFALDWEKVSKNRQCCIQGYGRLKNVFGRMLCHAVTLELLNQYKGDKMLDYIEFKNIVENNPSEDKTVAKEIRKIEKEYCDNVRDFKKFNEIEEDDCKTETEKAIRHLFKCVEAQFRGTKRNRSVANYESKFTEYLKNRWIKNRKKAGLVFNLKERDIIFLTKLCMGNEEEIRLVDLFKEYEKRGIFLDATSQEYLQEYYIKLNIVDIKSDSGDAQYVRRII